MGKAPSPPDPYQTAAAQTQSNQQTAAYNAALNRVSTYTPYGNMVYSQTGTDTSGAPTWRSDITLAPEAQQQLDNQLKQNNQLSQLGFTLGNQAAAAINQPYSDAATSRDAAANAYYKRQTAYLDPQYANQQNDLNSRLANQGVVQGSEAWNRAQDELARQKTFAYDQAQQGAISTGDNAQATQLQLQSAIKNAPLNQLNALRSGTQIQNPTFQNAPGASAAPTDVAGIINQEYQNQLAASNNFMNGLFGLGAGAITKWSDRRLKRAIRRIGATAKFGLPIYRFKYIDSDEPQIGVMAQDVIDVRPQAVFRMPNGFLAVDYGQIA